MDRHAEQVTVTEGRDAARRDKPAGSQTGGEPPGLSRRSGLRGLALAALLLTLASGCTTTAEQLLPADMLGGSPPTAVTRVVAWWSNDLMTGVDPVHNGAPLYGLAARVFLFGPDQKEYLTADGKIVVDLYAVLPEQPQGPPVRLETWEIKKDILNGVCLRRDGVGTGYTLNLPWEHYRPDVRHLDMRVRYEPTKGATIYTRDPVVLAGGPGSEVVAQRRVETGDHRVVAATTAAAPPAPPQAAGAMGAPFPVAQPPVMPAGFPVQQPPGAVQPALYQQPAPAAPTMYQMPGQASYQPQPAPPFPGGQR